MLGSGFGSHSIGHEERICVFFSPLCLRRTLKRLAVQLWSIVCLGQLHVIPARYSLWRRGRSGSCRIPARACIDRWGAF